MEALIGLGIFAVTIYLLVRIIVFLVRALFGTPERIKTGPYDNIRPYDPADWDDDREEEEEEEDDNDEYNAGRERLVWSEVEVHPNRQDGEWVRWKTAKVVGTSHQMQNIARLQIAFRKPGQVKARLTRDPGNEHGDNAVRVEALLSDRKEDRIVHIGYLDRVISVDLADSFSDAMPIAAEITRMAVSSKAASVKISILIPPKKARTEYEL